MNGKKLSLLVIILVSFLAIVYTLASTYAVVINVREEEGRNEIINEITLRDLVTDENGVYNSYYYDIKNELDITSEEATLLMVSTRLNKNLQVVLDSIVDYKLNNNSSARMSNEDIYNLIVDGVNNTGNLSQELRNKVITKSSTYIQDISNYLYDIEVSLIGV